MIPGETDAFEVVLAATTWCVNGVNVFSANLARGLVRAGTAAHVLLTEEGSDLVDAAEPAMPRPADVSFRSLPLPGVPSEGWGLRWGAMVRYLERAAPCVYVPNYDWRHSCVCPRLPKNVVVVGVVHSDDPLHYDHVRRLGSTWNAIVAVSDVVAARTADLCPGIRDRIVTIPIGVALPTERPRKTKPSGALRLVYHGTLKQHQKRVFDLTGIVEAALDAGVPVELIIVGGGPDEAELRDRAASLVDRGVIRFAGVMSSEAAAAVLDAQDVYVLASEFEGLPNALIEAMGRGCVPVVTRSDSGIPQLVRDGRNGFLVGVGDVGAFADRLRLLWIDDERRDRMSQDAFNTVRTGRYAVEDMVAAYRHLFARAWDDVRAGRFVRSRGHIVPPPPEVGGIRLFPVPLPYVDSELGSFPSADDAEDYEHQVRLAEKDAAPSGTETGAEQHSIDRSLADIRVIVAAPVWSANGVNEWSEDLVRGLRHAGLDAHLLLTEESTELVSYDEPRRGRPCDVPIEELEVAAPDNWGARWGAMIRTLEAAAPCIYFPTYDWRHSCVVPALSNRVIVVGTLHDTEGLYTEHAKRLGSFWNAVVATSRPVERHILRSLPQLVPRLAMIPHSSHMVGKYMDLFCRLTADLAAGRFRRVPGHVLPPPKRVGSHSLFPFKLTCASEFGVFPRPADVERFREELARLPTRPTQPWP